MNETKTPSCAFLRECMQRFDECEQRVDALEAAVSNDDANRSPGPKRWSIAQCIEHLVVTAKLYETATEEAIRRAREAGNTGKAPYGRGTWVGRFILSALDKGRSKRVGAPRMFQPSAESIDFASSCARLRTSLDTYRAWIRDADGLALGSIKVATPISRFVKISLAQAFEIHSKHALRHMEQAEEVRAGLEESTTSP